MDNNFEELLENFKEIAKEGWHKGINTFTNSVGLTFEDLLHKKADSMFFLDFDGIEIKCSQRFSRYPLSLFTATWDGPNLYETNVILQKYGRNDYQFHEGQKTLFANLKTNELTKINKNYYFKLKINYEEELINLEVYDINQQFVTNEAYISFKTLEDHIKTKLSNLALVLASKQMNNDMPYFRYYKIDLYKLKSFNTFLDLIEKCIINIKLVCRVSRSGDEKGRQRNKNLLFTIDKQNVPLLFDLIKSFDYDKYTYGIQFIN